MCMYLTWRWARIAVAKRISSEALRARTHRSVIYNNTLCTSTTWSRAWILTFFPYACPVALTFGVNTALRSTIWWNTHVVCQAWARWSTSYVSALRVWSTGRWYTWVYRFRRWSLNNSCSKRKMSKILWHSDPWSVTSSYTTAWWSHSCVLYSVLFNYTVKHSHYTVSKADNETNLKPSWNGNGNVDSSVTLSTTNPTQTVLESNLHLWGAR